MKKRGPFKKIKTADDKNMKTVITSRFMTDALSIKSH